MFILAIPNATWNGPKEIGGTRNWGAKKFIFLISEISRAGSANQIRGPEIIPRKGRLDSAPPIRVDQTLSSYRSRHERRAVSPPNHRPSPARRRAELPPIYLVDENWL